MYTTALALHGGEHQKGSFSKPFRAWTPGRARGLGEGPRQAWRLGWPRLKHLVFPVGQLIPDLQKKNCFPEVFLRSLSLVGNFERKGRGMGTRDPMKGSARPVPGRAPQGHRV